MPSPGTTAQADPPAPAVPLPRRRGIEFTLIVLAVLLSVYGYCDVGLAKNGTVPPGAAGYGAGLGVLALLAHLAVRLRAPYADPLLLPIARPAQRPGPGAHLPARPGDPGRPGRAHPARLVHARRARCSSRSWSCCATTGCSSATRTCRVAAALVLLLLPIFFPAVNGARIWIRVAGFSIQPGEFAKVLLAVFFAGLPRRQPQRARVHRPSHLAAPAPHRPGARPDRRDLAAQRRRAGPGTGPRHLAALLRPLRDPAVRRHRPHRLDRGRVCCSRRVGAVAVGRLEPHVHSRVEDWLHPFASSRRARAPASSPSRCSPSPPAGCSAPASASATPSSSASPPSPTSSWPPRARNWAWPASPRSSCSTRCWWRAASGPGLGLRDPFGRLLAVGLASIVALQVFVIAGGVMGLIPLTGMAMPFLAQGGSSVVTNWIIVALLIRLSDSARGRARNRPTPRYSARPWRTTGDPLHPARRRLLLPAADRPAGQRRPRPARRGRLAGREPGQPPAQRSPVTASRAATSWSAADPSPAPGTPASSSATNGPTPRARCTRRSPASPRRRTAPPCWRAPRTTSSPAPTRCSPPFPLWNDFTRPPAPRRPCRHHHRPGGAARPRTGDSAAGGARWPRSNRRPAGSWRWSARPSYDPGELSGTGRRRRPAWARLNAERRHSRCSTGRSGRRIRPAPTFKVVTAAAALDAGVVTDVDAPTDSARPVPAARAPAPGCRNEAKGCEDASLRYAFQWSCNTVFARLGVEVGLAGMLDTARRFGFNDRKLRIPSGSPPAPSTPGWTRRSWRSPPSGSTTPRPRRCRWRWSRRPSPTAARSRTPHLVERDDPRRRHASRHDRPAPVRQAMSPVHGTQLQRADDATWCEDGTGRNAAIPGATVGGKTGTAQHGVGNSGTPYAWFISWAQARRRHGAGGGGRGRRRGRGGRTRGHQRRRERGADRAGRDGGGAARLIR